MPDKKLIYNLSSRQVLEKFNSSEAGLNDPAVNKLRLIYGFNEIPDKKRSILAMLLKQFDDTMVYILLLALCLSVFMPFLENELKFSNFLDAFVITAILLLNALLGLIQEYKAENAILHLKKLSEPAVRVRRNGTETILPSRELVPGDVVFIEAGDSITADGRLLIAENLKINESTLTGESDPQTKTEKTLNRKNIPAADQDNMVFSGTLVTEGTGLYVVIKTALNTHIGKIAGLVSTTVVPETPLAKRMKKLGRVLALVVIALCLLVFLLGFYKGMPLNEIILIGLSLAVSAVPEGLPAVITVSLAIGVQYISQKKVLVRKLEALETLGSVTVICSDKTGTITENHMTVTETWVGGSAYKNKSEKLLAEIGASCNHALLPNLGDPTEIALLEYAKKISAERIGIEKEEVPFTSENKYMKTKHKNVFYLKGAPEVIAELCSDVLKTEVFKKDNKMAKKGLRVLACAIETGKDIHFIGLIGMEDPPRKTAKTAVILAKNAGIRTIMITGDNILTAKTIAAKVGITGQAVTGREIDGLSDNELQKSLKSIGIIARVSPEHKLRVLKALQANKQVVAMSGDGVNDAPALKGADVGIAMGKVGTETAREAASVVLADDHFASIVTAISEGRRIYDNIKKFVVYLLRSNFDELLFIITAILLNLPLPYLALHILLINLFTDGLPALALAAEEAEPGIMERPPRPINENILHGEWKKLIIAAFFAYLLTFSLYYYFLKSDVQLEKTRTVTLSFALLFELFMAFSIRSNKPVWEIGMFSNKYLVQAVSFPILLLLLLLYSPLGIAFEFVPLGFFEWGIILFLSCLSFLTFEFLKTATFKKLLF